MPAILSHYNLAIVIQEQRRGNAVRQLRQETTLLRQQLGGLNQQQAAAAQTTGDWENKADSLGTKIKRVLVPAILLATTAATAFAKDSVAEFAQFDQKLKESFTLLPDASSGMKQKLSDDMRSISVQYGVMTDETLPALYQALSAGVPEANAMQAIELATKAAIAGVADLEKTMKTGQAVVNAYGGEVYDLNEVYDMLFTLIRYGVLNMNDLNNGLSKVTSVASETRTPFEDIAAALVVMTRQGDSASEAFELLSFLLMQLGITGSAAFNTFKEASGKSYRQWIKEGNGLVDAMIAIDEHAQKTGQAVSDMIGGDTNFFRDQQAARGAMELTGLHLKELKTQADNFTETAGAMSTAYATAADNAQQDINIMKASWEDLKLTIGETIWTQELFFGATGEQMTEYATNLVKLFSGAYDRETWRIMRANETVVLSMEEVEDKLKSLGNLTNLDWNTAPTALNAQLEGTAMRLAELSPTYEDFLGIMKEFGLIDTTDWFSGIKHLDVNAEHFYDGAKAMQEMAASGLEATEAQHKLYETEQFFLGVQDAQNSQLTSANELLFQNYDAWENVTAAWTNVAPAGATLARIIRWVYVETHALSDATMTYMDTLGRESKNMFDAMKTLEASSTGWQSFIVNNTSEINKVMSQLGTDLDQEQRDAMWNIINTAEEGGAEWLNAWGALQTDLTETQRNELVAQLADLESTHGEMRKVWGGDKEAALSAAEEIIGAAQAIDQAYKDLALEISTQMIYERFGEQTAEAQQAIYDTMLAMGEISPQQHTFLSEELGKAQKLEEILPQMWTDYLADGKLTTIETNNIATAMELVNTHANTLTTEGLEALIDKALSDTGGFPKWGAVIKEDVIDRLIETEEKTTALTEEPFVPEVELDKTEFDRVYGTMMTEIENALGPWDIHFRAVMDNSFPNPSNQGYQPDSRHHSGVSAFIVPPGYPRDSYLIGLTSGERFTVESNQKTTSQPQTQNRQKQGDTNIVIHNHSREAAALTMASLHERRRRELNDYMGI